MISTKVGIAVAALTSAGVAGWVAFSPKQETLIDLKITRNELVSQLYQEYGGSKIGKKIDELANDPSIKSVVDLNVSSLEICQFRADCRNVGLGNFRTFLTQKGKDFFHRADVINECKKYAKLEKIIEEQSVAQNLPNQDDCDWGSLLGEGW